MEQTVVEAVQPSRNRAHGQVILVVLLVIAPLLALLVREQARVIEAQRVLIRQLAIDSAQLNSIRVRELQNRAKPAAPSQTPPAETQQQPSPAPKPKNHKRRESRQDPPPPQEYPATRQIPARNSV